MNIDVAKIEIWNGCSFKVIDFKQSQTQDSLGAVIREYVAVMGVRLIYWCKNLDDDEPS